jgi:hypothetical protein
MAIIKVLLQPMKFPSKNDVEYNLVLSENLIRNAFVPIDTPSADADYFTREMICTKTAVIDEVMLERKRAAKIISDALTEALLDAMGINDTEMGYRKNEITTQP